MRKEGERRAGALIGAGENGDSLFFFSSFFYRPTRGGGTTVSLFRSAEPKSAVPALRFKCPARCEERRGSLSTFSRSDTGDLSGQNAGESGEPGRATAPYRSPSPRALSPLTRRHSSHMTRTGTLPTSAAPACHVERNRSPPW